MADTTISQLTTVNALTATNYIPISDGINTTKLGTDSLFGFRNRIINGDMRIDQRNNGAVVSLPAYTNTIPIAYPVDRWRVWNNTNGTCNTQQSTDAPAGYTNSTSITITLPDTELASNQYLVFWSRNEANMFLDFKFGTQFAKVFTVSFWVKSSLTGVFGGAIRNYNLGNTIYRSYPFSYIINNVNTWEYKTITIPGDTSSSWVNTQQQGVFDVLFSLGSGSTFTSVAGSWYGGNFINATGSTSVIGVNGATFNITGIQVEEGSTATPFEFRPYGLELSLCQRYFISGNPTAGPDRPAICWLSPISPVNTTALANYLRGTVYFPNEMRTRLPVINAELHRYYTTTVAAASGYQFIDSKSFTVYLDNATGPAYIVKYTADAEF